MKKYRLVISSQAKLLGHFESDTPSALDAVKEIARCLAANGFDLELQVADGEQRLLLSGPDGIKTLGREALFNPVTLAGLFSE
ncbi:MAG: cytoplasmic protein [Pseudomonas sp.]